MRPFLIASMVALALLAVGCGNKGDTDAPQVEKSGPQHPPGVAGGTTRPQ